MQVLAAPLHHASPLQGQCVEHARHPGLVSGNNLGTAGVEATSGKGRALSRGLLVCKPIMGKAANKFELLPQHPSSNTFPTDSYVHACGHLNKMR